MKKNDGNQPRIIGLTGAYCAGKNHVARLFEARGVPVLDVDKLGHHVLEIERDAVAARFGSLVLGPDGAVDRRRLGAVVFGNPEELAALEGIVHPAVNRLTLEWIAGQEGRSCMVNAALLHKSAVFDLLDAVILVKAPVLTRLLRARKRDRLPWAELWKRFASQREFTAQYFSRKSDIYTIYNRGCTSVSTCFWRGSLEKQAALAAARLGILGMVL
ncbi:MAG: dephospho-CoA kinase [Spirochaetaceae bacterium]|jgi:dephospho-CoA kinase|nr:dephospho-CoA kinase [Spirochaetaceae bacterium]